MKIKLFERRKPMADKNDMAENIDNVSGETADSENTAAAQYVPGDCSVTGSTNETIP